MERRSGEKLGVNDKLFNRRTYLKALGVSAAALGAGTAVSGSAAAAEYTEIVLDPGERRSFHVGSGETLENLLIDVSASEADVSFSASGDDWTIRNIGIRGVFDIGGDTGGIKYVFGVEGNGLIENVYMGDGHEDGIRKGALIVPPDHAGHIDVQNMYVSRWTANACYVAGPARLIDPGKTDGEGGSTGFTNCYFSDNNIAHLRIASDGSFVRDSVIHNTSDVPPHPSTSGGDSGVVNSRGFYTGYGDPSQVVMVENCDIRITDDNTNGGASVAYSGEHSTYGDCSTIRIVDSEVVGEIRGEHTETQNIGNNPDIRVPAGVPQTPEEAASGSAQTSDSTTEETTTTTTTTTSDSTTTTEETTTEETTTEETTTETATQEDTVETDYENIISIYGTDGAVANYEFSVTGALEKTDANGASIDSEDVIDGSSATGTVAGGIDSYGFEGDLAHISIDGEARVTVNGEEINLADYEFANVISLTGGSGSNIVEYTFTVDGDLKKSSANGASIDPGDSISGSTATGTLGGGVDSYRFSGSVTDLGLSGDATVTVNGEELDPADYAEEETNVLSISGGSRNNPIDYAFSVTGSLSKSDAAGATIDSEDSISGSTATGTVAGGTDSYEFTGEVVDFTRERNVSVVLNRQKVDERDF
ncbi:hypothetical protein [Haladaptatus sp. DJG-WS-42]|uniref:hypothetical protein n=1 Tax=Haladaptatus sp. DJG-WS-42 TaxID=3120516 RepID=UPI0030D21A32